MMKMVSFRNVYRCAVVLVALNVLGGCGGSGTRAADRASKTPAKNNDPGADARRMIEASRTRLAPVYAPLAEQLAEDLDLAGKTGVGIDVGSGPGTLVVELCERTKLHWINADINPHFFPHFFRMAEERGHAGRVSAVRADAQALPFRDDYADVVVSRGSFWLWGDKVKAFGQVLRVLKPGGVAYIGRGFSENLPLDVAKKVRGGQGGGPKYDVAKTAGELRSIMKTLGVTDYRIIRPRLNNEAGINYGVWVRFRKH